MTTNTSDAIVVGGGIVGCLSAYLLACEGLSVTLLEADAVGSHASGFAFGELGVLDGAGLPHPLLDFSVWSYRQHEPLADELSGASGVPNYFQRSERLKLAFDEDSVREYKRDLKWQKDLSDFQIQWLGPEDVIKVEPMASPNTLGAVHVGGTASLEPYRYTLAACQAAERAGARVLLRRATGLISSGGRCLGVTLEGGGRLEGGMVALAQGPWTGEASSWCGVDIPVRPLKGQILRLQHQGSGIKATLAWKGSYATSKPDGLVWAGTTQEDVGFDAHLTDEARNNIMADLLTMAPGLAEAQLVQQTACLRPLSADSLPIVGQVPGWENLFVGTGAGRKGLLWSTGMSYALRDLMLQGRTNVPGVEHLDPGRFSGD